VADRIGAAEDHVQSPHRELVLDPRMRKAELNELIVADNTILGRGQIAHKPNWSRFGPTIGPNLDQFAGFGAVVGFAHADVSVRGG
jgi:hypothetical protein